MTGGILGVKRLASLRRSNLARFLPFEREFSWR